MTRRTLRVGEVIRDELSRLISRERILEGALITITYINVSADLQHADVYYTSLNPKLSHHKLEENFEGLRHSWQKQIGHKMQTKYTPRLRFRVDETQQRGDRIMQILDSLEKETKKEEQQSE